MSNINNKGSGGGSGVVGNIGCECLPEVVGGERGGDGDFLAGNGMDEFDTASYERYASVGVAAFVAIFQVATDRASYSRQLNPYLMLSTGKEPNFQKMIAVG